VVNVGRGVLIGIAEIVPGVSGGTIALIVGVYTTLISGASRVVAGFVAVVRRSGPRAAREQWRSVEWWVIIPVLVGMLTGIVLGAAFLEPVIQAHPVETRAVFAGLIIASLWVPIRMVGRNWNLRMVILAGLGAVVAFSVTGLPALDNPSASLWWVAPAAAVAVCALVLPGVSGSFLLLSLGMYEPTLAAVNDRDFVYLGVFIAGAIVGLALFVRVLQWLLVYQRVLTLVVMTGLMAGSLRALWPWQNDGRELLPVPPESTLVWAWLGVGFAVVVITLVVERIAQPFVKNADLG
jgi:putative membrane protein